MGLDGAQGLLGCVWRAGALGAAPVTRTLAVAGDARAECDGCDNSWWHVRQALWVALGPQRLRTRITLPPILHLHQRQGPIPTAIHNDPGFLKEGVAALQVPNSADLRHQGQSAATMVKNKGSKVSQMNKIVYYTEPVQPLPQTEKEGEQGLKAPEQDIEDPIPSMNDLMVAIQGSKTEEIHKIDEVAVEVNLLLADIHKILDQVGTTEQDITALQVEMGHLLKTVLDLQKLTVQLEKCAEDSEGHSRRNKLRFVGFLERAKGPSDELEEWITATLKPTRLSKFFSIERAQGLWSLHRSRGLLTCNDSPPRLLSAMYPNTGPPLYQGQPIFKFPHYTQ
ncbi:hypothetical protein NDU88_004385 [Pleurodeles waltl]|uniref:Uncharacterized protein n=1 Tax=Pleurodeles waltl TaxID=8319 RepID=A0AAV7MDW6_PLEWA|nr:hypothetical protein NDU88_004385 [Pleurodeles waltl]